MPLQRNQKARRTSLYPETIVQKSFLQWLQVYHPQARKSVIKIHNEGLRTAANSNLLTALGLHAGASDLFIAWPSNGYHGLWLEIKRDGYKVTKSNEEHYLRQLQFISLMRARGYAAEFAFGVDACIKVVTDYLR